MDKKFEYYDIVVPVIPGILLIISVGILLKLSEISLPIPKLSAAAEALVLLCFAFASGQIVQGIGGTLEGFYHWTMGGRPSDQVMSGEDKRIHGEGLQNIKNLLREDERIEQTIITTDSKTQTEENGEAKKKEGQRLFVHAMHIAKKHKLGNVERFVALYGYHRTMLTIGLLVLPLAISMWCFKGTPNTKNAFIVLVAASSLLLLISWFRTKKFGFHYSREVLGMAKMHLKEKQEKKTKG